jgi:hypothetical protein
MHSAQLALHVKKLQQSLNFKRFLLLFDLAWRNSIRSPPYPSEQLGRQIAYGGDDLGSFEQRLRALIPASRVYDIIVMMRRYQMDGANATAAEIDRLSGLLGHPPRSYRDFAQEMAAAWRAA